MSIYSEMAAIQSRIDALSGGAALPQKIASIGRRSELAGPPLDPQAGAQFQAMISQALGNANAGEGHGAAMVPPAQLEPLISRNAATYQVDPALVKAVIANESGFNSAATSPVGAQGLMQLMPATANSLGVQNSYDPAQNVQAGTRYLRGLYDRFGDWKLAVAAYNAGPGAVERYNGVPPYKETQNYVASVFQSFQKYRSTQ